MEYRFDPDNPYFSAWCQLDDMHPSFLSSVFFLHTTDFLEIWPEYTLLCYTTLCGFQNQQIRGPMGKSGDSLAPLDLASRIHFHSITSEFFKFCLIAVQIQTHGCRGTAQLHNNEHHNSGGLR